MRFVRCRAGFTLIEVSVVVTLMGLLVSIAVVKLGAGYQHVAFAETIEQVIAYERGLRLIARHAGQRLPVRIDLKSQCIETEESTDESGFARRFVVDRLGRVRINAAWVDGIRVATIGTDPIGQDGQPSYLLDGRGQTPNVAFHLIGPDEQAVWIVFIGLSGQALVLHEEADLTTLFSTLQ